MKINKLLLAVTMSSALAITACSVTKTSSSVSSSQEVVSSSSTTTGVDSLSSEDSSSESYSEASSIESSSSEESSSSSSSPEEEDYYILFVFHTNGGNNISATYLKSSEILEYNLPTPEKEGHTFDGWYFENSFKYEYDPAPLLDGRELVEVYAKYSINKYKIYVNDNDHTVYEYNYGDKIAIETPEKDEKIFKGFYLNPELTELFNYVTMPSFDLNLYPKYETRNYLLQLATINPHHGHIEGDVYQDLEKGEVSSAVTAVSEPGYKFECWSNGDLKETTTFTIHSDTVIYAVFLRQSLDLPIINVNTIDYAPILNKEDYVNCEVSVENSTTTYNFDDVSAKISEYIGLIDQSHRSN